MWSTGIIAHKYFLYDKYYFDLGLGFGIMKFKKTSSGGRSDRGGISTKIHATVGVEVSKTFNIFLQFKKIWDSSISVS